MSPSATGKMLMAFRRSLWFPSVVSALPNHRFIACALAAILVCKVIPSHSVSGPARYLDARAVRWCRGFYRAYRSETVRQLNVRREMRRAVRGPPRRPGPRPSGSVPSSSAAGRSGTASCSSAGGSRFEDGVAGGRHPLAVPDQPVGNVHHGRRAGVPGQRAGRERGQGPALGVQQPALLPAQGLDGSVRFQQREARRGAAHGAGQRQGVPRAGAGAQHRPPCRRGCPGSPR